MNTESPPQDAYSALGVKPIINACGIYTDLGGSTLEPELWAALSTVNERWASVPELLDRTGGLIAGLVGAEAARVVPGASAGVALATAALIAGDDDDLLETLPLAGDAPNGVVQQVVHGYKYTRCALLGGGRIVDVGTADGTTADALERTLAAGGVVAVLHPLHLEHAPGALPLADVVRIAHDYGAAVIVDAAYMVHPVAGLAEPHRAGADVVAISAKYYGGPNAGGFLAGRADLMRRIARIDFTEFESGPWRTFGRAFKLDRTTIAATALALERWVDADHDARWERYGSRAQEIAAGLQAGGIATARPVGFTFDERVVAEPVNAVHVADGDGALVAALASGTPAVRCIDLGDGILFCTECVADDELEPLVSATLDAMGAR